MISFINFQKLIITKKSCCDVRIINTDRSHQSTIVLTVIILILCGTFIKINWDVLTDKV
jgi:hypothetical protein